MTALNKHIKQIKELCAQHQVRSLFAFGSVLTDKFNADSDIDLIVDIDSNDPLDYSDHYFALKYQLENILKKPIDLLEEKALKNPFVKKQIDNTKMLVYGR
jgi:predicted nucleotidyltransferase